MSIRLSYASVPALATVLVVTGSIVEFGIIRGRLIMEGSSIFALVILLTMILVRRRVPVALPAVVPMMLLIFMVVASFLVGLRQSSMAPVVTISFFSMTALALITLAFTAGQAAMRTNAVIAVLTAMVVLTASVSLAGFSTFRFSGVFDNPNGMGRYAAISFLFVVLYLFAHMQKLSGRFRVALAVTAVVLLLALFASNSRAALVSALAGIVAVISIPLAVAFARGVTDRRMSRRFLRRGGWVGVVTVLVLVAIVGSGLLDLIINKFEATSLRGDVSQGRLDRWAAGFAYVNLFGYEYYQEVLNLPGVHNNYLSFTLNYGLVLSVVFYLYFLSAGWFFLRRYAVRSCTASMIGLSMVVQFLVYSVFETGSAIMSVWIVAIALGSAAANDRSRIWRQVQA